jgi:hypothetical protein
MARTKCFYKKDGIHEYDPGGTSCRLCGDARYMGQGLFRRNKDRTAYRGVRDTKKGK